ncbi:hypothetical protein HGA64_04600 [Candidatus Falkowbacteria bacterium]|nr:hypothetical protein [Candidatus Falkowbacteria bacterium]
MSKIKRFIYIITIFLAGYLLIPAMSEAKTGDVFVPPISDALSRVTKKPFGIKVSPKNSSVSPERFTGYHTGVDFETTSLVLFVFKAFKKNPH